MAQQNIRFQFYHDAGHGWLEVTMMDLDKLRIKDKISSYSYMDGYKVYLEEDCDLSRFLDAYCTYYAIDRCTFFKALTKSIYAGDYAHIRDFASYVYMSG